MHAGVPLKSESIAYRDGRGGGGGDIENPTDGCISGLTISLTPNFTNPSFLNNTFRLYIYIYSSKALVSNKDYPSVPHKFGNFRSLKRSSLLVSYVKT